MSIKLELNAYGKNAVNLSKIIRHADHHEFRQVSVNVLLEGDFATAYTHGDNTRVLPTDTQKNTVYVLAREHFTASIEAFGLVLARHFQTHEAPISQATISITEHGWQRMTFEGQPHPHAFTGTAERRTARVEQSAAGVRVWAGLQELLLLKTTDSAFVDFLRDDYTILPEATDRILATKCDASWEYVSPDVDFDASYQQIKETLLRTFAGHHSLSVQHTLYAIGEAILQQHAQVKSISLTMPNRHHIPFNFTPLSLDNRNEIFVATDEPFGYISGTLSRD